MCGVYVIGNRHKTFCREMEAIDQYWFSWQIQRVTDWQKLGLITVIFKHPLVQIICLKAHIQMFNSGQGSEIWQFITVMKIKGFFGTNSWQQWCECISLQPVLQPFLEASAGIFLYPTLSSGSLCLPSAVHVPVSHFYYFPCVTHSVLHHHIGWTSSLNLCLIMVVN